MLAWTRPRPNSSSVVVAGPHAVGILGLKVVPETCFERIPLALLEYRQLIGPLSFLLDNVGTG